MAALTPVKFSWGPNGSYEPCPTIGYKAFVVRVSLRSEPGFLDASDNSIDYFASIGKLMLTGTRLANVNLPFPVGAGEPLIREKTLREFCHVLGCLHEHQRGLCDADFNKSWIQAHYGYNDEQYAANFINIPTSDAYYGASVFGAFDDTSIMLYSIPPEAFSNKSSKCYLATPVVDLSPTDRAGLSNAYRTVGDPLLKSAQDFASLTASFDEISSTKRAQANVLRNNAAAWIKATPLLEESSRPKALLDFDKMALALEREADEAHRRADSYRLSPATTAKLVALIALVPND